MNNKFPELTVIERGSSGIEIRATLPEKFNCVEFTLRDDVAQPIFISPWMQFEPAKMNDWRLQMAHEIARRAIAHEKLVEQVASLQQRLSEANEIMDRRMKTQMTTYRMWKEDRARAGFPEDFGDLDFPPEMMSGYDSGRIVK